jgi:hypothetical protein
LKIAVVIPWREQPSRIPGYNEVRKWYAENLPEAKVYTCDHPSEVWLMSASRNDGVRAAEADGADVIIMSDADTIPEKSALMKAVEGAYQDNLMHLPYTEYRALLANGNEMYFKGQRPLGRAPRKLVKGACSGVNVFTPATWWSLGGNDEKFKQWGYEDTAMLRAHYVIKGTDYVRHKGIVYSFNHKEQPKVGNTNYLNNQKIYDEYLKVTSPQKMLELVAIPDIKDFGQGEHTFAMFILGNGRKPYLERTVASWEANLQSKPKYKIIFDDSGDKAYHEYLSQKYGDKYDVVPISDKPSGHPAAMKFVFDYINNLDVDYVLQLEEDWMLFRPLDISGIMSVMQENERILQMRIPRTIWQYGGHNLDLASGSIMKYHLDLKGSSGGKKSDTDGNSWYEWRGSFYFWSHNPNVFRKSICTRKYPDSGDHEDDFGRMLMILNPQSTVGFWAENYYDGYITHIGYHDDALMNSLPTLQG